MFLGFNVSRSQQGAADRVSRLDSLALQMEEFNYHNATMNSLQNFYLWDVSVSGPAKDFAPGAFARTMFTHEKVQMYALLDRIGSGAMSPAERDTLQAIRQAVDAFYAYDDSLVAIFKAEKIAEATKSFATADYFAPVQEPSRKLLVSTKSRAKAATLAAQIAAASA